MPLLHRKPFVRQKPPVDLKPDEQVFYCKVTNEIFRDYDDFFERTILCNSLVWSCAITGKPGLTYQEALESESRARQNLQNFPGPLVVPILYLTTLTHCSRLHELCDDIYTYTKDRYFAGEIIEVTNTNGTRQTCKILEVVTPPVQNGTANGHISNRAEDVVIVISDESDNEDGSTSSAHAGKKKSKVDVSLFKYKVKPLKSEGNEIIIKAAQMNRKKNVYSRDKLKLFLKQHCELRHSLLKVKSTTATKYKLSEQNFSHLFPDDPLAFPFSPTSRGRGRVAKHRGSFSNSQSDGATDGEGTPQYKNKSAREIERLRKHREEMKGMAKRRKEDEIASDLKKRKAEVLEAKKKEKEDKEKKREELKKILEEEKLKRKEEKERLKLEKEKVREKLREEKKKYAEYLKEWNKPREDMECEDLKELPSPMPVKTRLPSELFGDALMVLEFLNAFGELFDLQDEFPDGMTLEMLEEALVGNDTEGPLCELLFFFLSAIFQAHAEEEEEVAKEQLKEADTKDLTEALDEDADSTKCAVSAVAAFAAAWPQLYQGCTLRDLDLDSCTLSEILRLHILAAGADVTPANAKYRYQQQGGFDATDNACVELRLNNPGLLKKLSNIPVYDLTAADKLKLLQALCGQLLTLVSTRDFIEDNVEILKQARQEFRELKAEQHRKEREEAAARYRKKKEERLKEQEQKIKEKHDQLKEEEQRNSKGNAVEEDATQEELETSTESRVSAHIDRGHDTATEDEEEVGPSKRDRKGRKSLNELKDTPSREETEESGTEKREMLAPEEEEVFKREQQRKEKEMWEKIQIASSCTNIVPLGRDRLYRRYWVLNSVPGLFVEEDFEGLTEDMLQPYPVKTAINNAQSQGNARLSDTAPGSESSESGASGKVEQQPAEPHNTDLSQDQNSFVSPLEPSQPSTSSQDQILDASSTEELHKPVNKPNRWCVYSSPEQLDQLIEALNSRGKRESCLKESLHQEKTRLTERLTNFPVERFSIPDKVPVESKSARNSFKSAHNTNDASQLSAEKQLELRLKDLLLDIEDRTWQGTLGGIKAVGRDVWRAALESAHYALLGEAIPTQNGVRVLENDVKENGAMKIENEEANDGMNIKSGSKDRLCELKTEARSIVSTNASTPQPVNLVVRYLAIALLHLERGIERKFLKPPLGEADEVKKEQKDKKKKDDKKRRDDDQSSEKDDASDGGKVQKTLLDRWRESLTASTSLAQVFLHLSTLDRSILWAKSLLNARCKICHKKGDAENMLLCDGCDRGHHTYCLRPKIKTIPEDDWFCPECRPKQRFRRPSARQRPALDSEEEVFEELEEMEDEEEESEEEEETEVEDDETEEEYEIERQLRRGRTRVKLQVKSKSGKGSATTVAHGQGTEPRRYPSRSRSNTPKLTLSGAKKRRGKKVGRPKSLPNAEVKPLARLSGRMKNSRWSEGSFIELGVPRRRRRYRKAAARSPEYGASTSCRLRRLSDLDNSQEEPVRKKRKYTRRVEQTTPPPLIQSGKRGRKRKSADTVVEVLKVTGNRRSSGRNSGIHELSVCEQLIVDLVRHEDSWPFLKLVNKAQVTDYYDIIKKPVALNIIREKLNRCQYNYASDFIDDVELMFTNCFEYNPRNTSEAKAGMKLQAFFHNQVEKLGLPVKPANVDHPPQLAATKRSRI